MPKDIIVAKKDGFYFNKSRLNLAGNHTWNTVQPFNGKTISLDKLTGNFTRLWTVETKGMVLNSSIWGSNSTGVVKVDKTPWKNDGTLNKRYYKALEKIVAEADKKDIVTGVCLFDHAFNAYFPGGWDRHPFNGLGPSAPEYIHTKGSWNTFQRNHVKKVTKRLEDYDNVIYEVGNELSGNSVRSGFQKMVVKWVNKFTDKPVGVSYAGGYRASRGRTQDWMARTGADWAAPAGGQRIAGFKGAYIFDTDHASALRPNVAGLVAARQRGDALWLMDGFDGAVLRNQGNLTPDRNYLNSVLAS